jgi:membrane protein required for beta-lactamase induction
MKLLVLLIVLGLRQTGFGRDLFATAAGLMRRWRDGWQARGAREGWSGGVVLGFIVLPPALLAMAAVAGIASLGGAAESLAMGLLGLAVMLVVLLDRAQPDALEREQEAWLAADEVARDLIAEADPVALEAAAQAELARARAGLVAEQLRELFAPLFWFLLLGPVPAIAYYFLRLCAEAPATTMSAPAARLLHYAEWPVARVLSLSFALAGDFVATWQHWRTAALDTSLAAVPLLEESARVAQPVDSRLPADSLPGPMLVNALATCGALLHRALVIWVVLLALHTLWP